MEKKPHQEIGSHLQWPKASEVDETAAPLAKLRKDKAGSAKRLRSQGTRPKQEVLKTKRSPSKKRRVAGGHKVRKLNQLKYLYSMLRQKQVEEFHAFFNRLKAQYLGIPLYRASQPQVLLEGSFLKKKGFTSEGVRVVNTPRHTYPESVYRSRTPQRKNTRLEEKRLRPSASYPDISKSIYNPPPGLLSSPPHSSHSSRTPRHTHPPHTDSTHGQRTRIAAGP